jgi:hypothetical protein
MSANRLLRWRPFPVLLVGLLLLTPGLPGGLAGGALAQTGGSYDLTWSTIDGGGGTFSTGGSYSLGGTIGQPDPGQLSGGSYTIIGGFWSGASIPTAVTLAGFWVEARGDTLVVCWETVAEVDLVGFALYRSDTGAPDSFVRLHEGLIPGQAPGSPEGASYEWVDAGVERGQTYYYLLEDVDVRGQASRYGPVPGRLPPTALYRIYLPLVNR